MTGTIVPEAGARRCCGGALRSRGGLEGRERRSTERPEALDGPSGASPTQQRRFPADLLDEYAARYAEAGGARHFSDYVDVDGARASFKPGLREQIVFAQHNLASDGSFNEFHLVVARGVITHFNRTLSYRAHQVIYESLIRLGYLGVSSKETLRYTPHQRAYEELDATERFYRRLR